MMYEKLDHTADLMIKARGSNIEECFANAAYGMFDQIVEANKIDPKIEYNIRVEAENTEALLYNFLSELLYIFDTKKLVFSKFSVKFVGNALICTAWGEQFNPHKHKPKKEIKAVTYHMMTINKDEPSVTVLFDI